jgi:hypothetical protein
MMKRRFAHNMRYRWQPLGDKYFFTIDGCATSWIDEPYRRCLSTGVFLSLEDDMGLGADDKAHILGGNIRRLTGLSP